MKKYLLGVLMIGIFLASSAFFIPSTESSPVVIITLESVRAHNIPCYGYERDTAPNVCSLAEDGVLFERGYSNGPHTFSSMSALMTSRYPSEINKKIDGGLSKNVTTLPELLGEKGYETYGIARTYIRAEELGVDKGFDHYEDRNSYDSMDVVRRSREEVDTNQKFFLWAHMTDPHQGYSAPGNFSGVFAEESSDISADQTGKQFAQMNLTEAQIEYIKARYDEEILYSDYATGKLLQWLKEEGVYNKSLIIVVGDHGEDFREHRRHVGHGQSLREFYTHVPFIVKFPDSRFAGKKISTPVSQLDIVPTIEESIEEDFNHSHRGKSLYDILKGNIERQAVVSQMIGKKSLTTRNWRYIDQEFAFRINSTGDFIKKEEESEKLYNLSKAVENRSNVAEKHPDIINRLSNLMYRKINSDWQGEVRPLNLYLR